MAEYVFGIDVGGTTVKCGLFRVDGTVLDKWEIETRTEGEGSLIIPDVAETVRKKMEEKQIDRDQVAGLGIGVPGPVNSRGEVLGQSILAGVIRMWLRNWDSCWDFR